MRGEGQLLHNELENVNSITSHLNRGFSGTRNKGDIYPFPSRPGAKRPLNPARGVKLSRTGRNLIPLPGVRAISIYPYLTGKGHEKRTFLPSNICSDI